MTEEEMLNRIKEIEDRVGRIMGILTQYDVAIYRLDERLKKIEDTYGRALKNIYKTVLEEGIK